MVQELESECEDTGSWKSGDWKAAGLCVVYRKH